MIYTNVLNYRFKSTVRIRDLPNSMLDRIIIYFQFRAHPTRKLAKMICVLLCTQVCYVLGYRFHFENAILPTKFSSPKFSPMNHFKGQQGGHFWVYSNRSSSSRPGKFRSRTDHLTLRDQVINLLTSIPNIVIIHFLHD